MSCEACSDVEEITDESSPYLIRTCQECGREMKVRERGDHGSGLKLENADQLIIPSGWLKVHPDPLKGRGRFFKSGLGWFAEMIFLSEFPQESGEIDNLLEENDAYFKSILQDSELFKGLNVDEEEDAEEIFSILKDNKDRAEWYAYLSGVFNSIAEEAIEENETKKAAWAAAGAERFRSMVVFKQELEDVVGMGQSAAKLIELLETWDNNRTNADEKFWQAQFKRHAYALSQVFSVPVVFIQDNAYVGGTNMDREDARFVDFVYSGDSSHEAILIEIKTPKTRLLGPKYRSIYKPSQELSGSLIQIKDYKLTLIEDFRSVTEDLDETIETFEPRCLIIAGNGDDQLESPNKRRSFELFRNGLRNVEVITYDELFKKIEVLASLFNLTRTET